MSKHSDWAKHVVAQVTSVRDALVALTADINATSIPVQQAREAVKDAGDSARAAIDTDAIMDALVAKMRSETISGVKFAVTAVNTATRNAKRAV